MAKCMFCGLCTTVCPTECLTMTDDYDYSTFDITEHIFPFEDMKADEAEKRKAEWQEFQEQKVADSKSIDAKQVKPGKPVLKPSVTGKPAFRPKAKPASSEIGDKPKPKFKPRVMPKKPKKDD